MPGRKRLEVPLERLGLMVPKGLHDELVRLIKSEGRWSNRQEFAIEAIREKIERHRSGALVPDEGARETMRRVRST